MRRRPFSQSVVPRTLFALGGPVFLGLAAGDVLAGDELWSKDSRAGGRADQYAVYPGRQTVAEKLETSHTPEAAAVPAAASSHAFIVPDTSLSPDADPLSAGKRTYRKYMLKRPPPAAL